MNTNRAKTTPSRSGSLSLLLCFVLSGGLKAAIAAPNAKKAAPAAKTVPPGPKLGTKPGAKSGEVSKRGTLEVTARLLEVPGGAIIKRDLYDYATVLKYQVTAVHRGKLKKGAIIYVGHYNPWKPRARAADKRVKSLGGTLRSFQVGALHHMALEESMDDHFMGGVIDKYFGKYSGEVYWAIWTNAA